MFIEVDEGKHSPVDNSLENIKVIIANSGTYSVTFFLNEQQTKDLIDQLRTHGINKFNRFKV